MTMASANGKGTAEMEDEIGLASGAAMEDEWETHEAAHHAAPYATPEMEDEWETHEVEFYANPEEYSTPEMEWEAHEASPYAAPEMEGEWEDEASPYATPYAMPETEDEAARHARPASPRPSTARPHAAPRPHRAARPHAASRPGVIARPRGVSMGPLHRPRAAPGIRHITQQAPRIVPRVVHNVLGTAARGITAPPPGPVRRPGTYAPSRVRYGYGRYVGWRPGMPRPPYPRRQQAGVAGPPAGGPLPAPAAPGAMGPAAPGGGPRDVAHAPAPGRYRPAAIGAPMPLGRARRTTVASLLRQLSALFGEGESEATALEMAFFGTNEFEGELATHESAHEAALAEVLAAEAAHTESEAEAEALLGASLPLTITIMGGRRALRHVMPTLARGNARLIRGLHRGGPTGRQLLRAVPAIHRRTIASLRAALRAGRPVTPVLVARVLAGHTARVLGTPAILGPSLVRNTAIRQGTVVPARGAALPRRARRAPRM